MQRGVCCSTLHGWQCFAATGKCNTAGGRQQQAHRGCRGGAAAAPARWRRRRAPPPALQTAHLPAPALSGTAPPRWAPALRAPAGRPSRPGVRGGSRARVCLRRSSCERASGARGAGLLQPEPLRSPAGARIAWRTPRAAPGCRPGFKCAGCCVCQRFARLQTIMMTICSPSQQPECDASAASRQVDRRRPGEWRQRRWSAGAPSVCSLQRSACTEAQRIDKAQQANSVAVSCAGWHWRTAHRCAHKQRLVRRLQGEYVQRGSRAQLSMQATRKVG